MPVNSIITPEQCREEWFSIADTPAELTFLALLMKFPDLIAAAENCVTPRDLFTPHFSQVYTIILTVNRVCMMNRWQVSLEPLMMLQFLTNMGATYEADFIRSTEGMKAVQTISGWRAHVDRPMFDQTMGRVQDNAIRIHLYNQARQTQLSLMDKSRHPDARQVAFSVEQKFSEIGQMGRTKNTGLRRLGEYNEEYLRITRIQQAYPDLPLSFLKLPSFPMLMSKIGGGLLRGSMLIASARPKTGKSTLLMTMAIDAAMRGIPVLYLDTEMSMPEMYTRAMANISSVNEWKVRTGELLYNPSEVEVPAAILLQRALTQISDAPFYYERVAGKSPEQIAAIIRRFRNQYVGVYELRDPLNGQMYTYSRQGLVVYDWLKLPDAGGLKNAQETQLMGFLTSAIKDALVENDLPGIAGAQQNRDAAKATVAELEDQGDAFVSGSDRLNFFCSAMITLRNVSDDEASMIRESRPSMIRTGQDSEMLNDLPYNQLASLQFNRNGGVYKKGIPLYLHRGTARHFEAGTAECVALVDELRQKRRQSKPRKGQEIRTRPAPAAHPAMSSLPAPTHAEPSQKP